MIRTRTRAAERRARHGSGRGLRHLRAAAAGLIVGTLLLAGCGSVPAPGVNIGTQLDGRIPQSVLNLRLTDSTGQPRRLSDFAGKVVVISDAMTLCQETCPLDTATLVQTAHRLDAAGLGDKAEFLTITIDPVRDTVPQLAAYRKLYARSGGPSNWMVLTGSPADIHRLWSYFGVYVKKVPGAKPPVKNWRTGEPLSYDLEHSDEVFFLDGRGNERFVLEGMPMVPHKSEIPKVMYHFLSQHGRRNQAHPKPTAWSEQQALQVLGWLLNTKIKSAA
ncbi:MAG: SCO family protein [Microlunatus sp.]|nr:SCO family protein [Microlunatus sp.]